MITLAPTKYVVLTCSLGKYVWWPGLCLDFVPKGKRRGTPVDCILPETENQALKSAIRNLDLKLRRFNL